MSEKPDPLQRIANLEEMHERGTIKRGHIDEMLAELRRLHAENEALRAEIDDVKQVQFPKRVKNITEALKTQRDALLEALRGMVEMFKDVPTLEQNSFDEPPEPRTQWDYEAYLMIGEARAAVAKAEGA